MTHIHQFILIKHPEKGGTSHASTAGMWRGQIGAMTGCVDCGEIRTVWEDGTVEINFVPHERPDTEAGN